MSKSVLLNKQKGFTLVELIIVIAILAIATGIALPAYTDFIQRSQVRAVAKDFQSAIETARHHARTSGRSMTVCATEDVNAGSPECLSTLDGFNADGTSESMGWVVFRDLPDDDGNYDNKVSGEDEMVVKRVPFQQDKVRIVSNGKAVIHIAPRNRTGDTGTICIYAKERGSLDACSASGALNSAVYETRVTLSALGKATIK